MMAKIEHVAASGASLHAAFLGVLVAAAKKTTTTSSGGAAFSLLFLVVIIAAGYFLLVRPQRNRMRQQRQLASSIDVGNEVVTASGIVGTVVDLEGDEVTIQSGDSTVTMLRQAIAGLRNPVSPGQSAPGYGTGRRSSSPPGDEGWEHADQEYGTNGKVEDQEFEDDSYGEDYDSEGQWDTEDAQEADDYDPHYADEDEQASEQEDGANEESTRSSGDGESKG
jgi:preprotein translocase subunit YajC